MSKQHLPTRCPRCYERVKKGICTGCGARFHDNQRNKERRPLNAFSAQLREKRKPRVLPDK